jgi:aconitate hydratase
MGVLPCQLKEGTKAQTLCLDGTESFDILGIEGGVKPRQVLTLVIHRANGNTEKVARAIRDGIETSTEQCDLTRLKEARVESLARI